MRQYLRAIDYNGKGVCEEIELLPPLLELSPTIRNDPFFAVGEWEFYLLWIVNQMQKEPFMFACLIYIFVAYSLFDS